MLIEVRKTEEKNIVIDCSFEILEQVLREAQQVGILSHRHRVIVTNLVSLFPKALTSLDFFLSLMTQRTGKQNKNQRS